MGTLTGGQSINSIAAEATLDVDLRSLDQDVVHRLAERVREAARERFPPDGHLLLETERIGSRPAGRLEADHPLLRHIRDARAEAGLGAPQEIASSTDASVPLALGIPSCCVGVGLGEDVHKRSERLAVDGLAEGYAALAAAAGRIAADPGLVRRGERGSCS